MKGTFVSEASRAANAAAEAAALQIRQDRETLLTAVLNEAVGRYTKPGAVVLDVATAAAAAREKARKS